MTTNVRTTAITTSTEPSVRRLLAEVTESPTQAEAEAGLRAVLEDASLEFLVWNRRERAYVAADGTLVDLEAAADGRAVTVLPHRGEPVGALVHDPRLSELPAFHDIAAAASLA